MLKKWLALLVLCCAALPLTAQAVVWSLSTQNSTGGGTIRVRSMTAPPQTGTAAVYKYYTTHANVPVYIIPNDGYAITSLKVNGTPVAVTSPQQMGLTAYPTRTAQSVVAGYALQTITATATAGPGGTVTPSGTYTVTAGSTRSYTFTPNAGGAVDSFTSLPAGAVLSTAVPAEVDTPVVVTVANITGSFSFSGNFSPLIASAGQPQTVLNNGATVTLHGSATVHRGDAPTFSWVQIGGPATVTLAGADTAAPTFPAPATVGFYLFRLTATNSEGSHSAIARVNVSDSPVTIASVQCVSCHDALGVGQNPNVFTGWQSSPHLSASPTVMCASCHIGADAGGHPGSVSKRSVDRGMFTLLAAANGGVPGTSFCAQCHSTANQILDDYNASPHKQSANGPANCAACHGNAHSVNATLDPCIQCHVSGGQVVGHPFPVGATGCTRCHDPHKAIASACDGCHEAPPNTASHAKHFSGAVAQAGYGDTRSAKDFGPTASGYIMGCGTCHPQDISKHMNGVVDVELTSPAAPAGSLKALSPASASYTPGGTQFTDSRGYGYSNGSCSNVYCHSSKSWTTPTGVPDYFPDCAPPLPADLQVTTNYNTVTWGGPPLGCSGCHASPPRTRTPENAAAAGDSHSWISDYYGSPIEFMHTSNMMPWDWDLPYPDPISCMYCHNDTVKQLNSYSYDATDPAYPVIMGDVPIANHAKHVNGVNDVAFERDVAVPTIEMHTWSNNLWQNQRLSNASYDAPTKTCSNVACHLLRTNVKWGTPYKASDPYDCSRCHDNGSSCPDRAAALSHQPSITSTPAAYAAPGFAYGYTVIASEPGGGPLGYTLTSGPAGMTMSPAGVISWTPAANQMGSNPVKVTVNSGTLIAIQEFVVTVIPPNPLFTSTPVTTATAWTAYSYAAKAVVPTGLPAVSYSLTAPPSGMTINASSGSITWTPNDTQVGNVTVTVNAIAGGYSAVQSFTVAVSPSPITFTSTPVTTAQTQVAYSYPVTVSLAGVSSFSYSLITRPTGMSINASTGVISWTPTAVPNQVGSFPVTVQVTGGGYTNRQSFTVVVTASPITISSSPVLTAKVGVAYSYPVIATMPGGGTLTYTLPVRPTTAMTVNASGVISWTPTAGFVGNRAVTVTVTRGASTSSQSFTIVVSP